MVPGVRRAAFKQVAERRMTKHPNATANDYSSFRTTSFRTLGLEMRSRGIGTLFDAEAEVLRSRRFPTDKLDDLGGVVEPIEGRLWRVEAATITSKLAGKLGAGIRKGASESNGFWGYGGRNRDTTKSYGQLRVAHAHALPVTANRTALAPYLVQVSFARPSAVMWPCGWATSAAVWTSTQPSGLVLDLVLDRSLHAKNNVESSITPHAMS